MFGDLEALHHIKSPPNVDRLDKICGAKLIRIYHQVSLIDIIAVHAEHTGARLTPNAQPSALATSKIDDAVDRQQRTEHRNDLFRGTDRKGGQEAVEIIVVFVQLAFPPGLILEPTALILAVVDLNWKRHVFGPKQAANRRS